MSCGSLSGPFSSFRSRNLSTTSTTSQDSCGFNMEDLVSSELCNYWQQEESNTQVPLEIGNFSINSNSVDMEQEEVPHILQPMQTIHPLQPLHHNDLDMGIQKQKLKVRNEWLGACYNIFFGRFWNLASPHWPMLQWHSTPCTNTRRSVTHRRCWTLPSLWSKKCHQGRICQWHCQSWQNPAVCLRRLNLPPASRLMTRSGDRWSSSSWRYSMKGNKIKTSK